MTTPEQEHHARQRGSELAALAGRWGEEYLLTYDYEPDLFYATHRTRPGPLITAGGRAELDRLLENDLAERHQQGRARHG